MGLEWYLGRPDNKTRFGLGHALRSNLHVPFEHMRGQPAPLPDAHTLAERLLEGGAVGRAFCLALARKLVYWSAGQPVLLLNEHDYDRASPDDPAYEDLPHYWEWPETGSVYDEELPG